MARPLRIEYEGAFYHITCRGNERRKIYYDNPDYDKFRSYLKDAQDKYGFRLHTYVLMSNHYHLLLETPEPNLSKLMHFINGSYTNYINRRRERSGHLFHGRYKAILVDKDRYLLELSRYIHLNPVRAKVVDKPENYPYSSYKVYISREKDHILYPDLILGMISRGGREATRKYRAFVERGFTEKLRSPLKDIYGGSILGGKTFIKETLGRVKREVLRREETSYRRQLQSSYSAEEIISLVCKDLNLAREESIKESGKPRKVTMYLLKKHTGMTNGQIGEVLGGLSYSAVAKAQARFAIEMKRSRSLRKQVEKISAKMSNVKG